MGMHCRRDERMKTVLLIYQTLVRWLIQTYRVPRTLMNAAKNRRRQTAFKAAETERIDRIRNPWKYLGK